MGVEHRYIEVNGLRLHAVDFGGSGPPIVCLHAATSHAWMWRAVAGVLEGHRRILAVDLRGHGDSQWSDHEAYETEDLARDLVGAIETSPEPVDVVGASWGGLIALRASILAPQLMNRLVLVDVPPSFSSGTGDIRAEPAEFKDHAAVVAWERQANPLASEATVETLAALGTRPGSQGRLVRKYDPYFGWRWPFRADDHWAALAATTVPTLLVRGENSAVLSTEVFDKMAAANLQARRVLVAGSGHLVPIDNPAGMAQVLLEFLT